MRFCPYCQKAVMVEIVNIDLKHKPEWYLKNKNSAGLVPTLEHDGKLITDSTIIPQYLDDIFPDTTILPSDPYKKAQQKMLMEKLNAVHSAYQPVFRNYLDSKNDKATMAIGRENLEKAFETAEQLLQRDFYGGEKVGYADLMIWPFIERTRYMMQLKLGQLEFDTVNFPSQEKYPKMTGWFKRMMQLPEINLTHIDQIETVGEYFTTYRDGKPNYDVELS